MQAGQPDKHHHSGSSVGCGQLLSTGAHVGRKHDDATIEHAVCSLGFGDSHFDVQAVDKWSFHPGYYLDCDAPEAHSRPRLMCAGEVLLRGIYWDAKALQDHVAQESASMPPENARRLSLQPNRH